jgi:hypothetical protein
MTIDQIVQAAQNGSFLVFALMLWWTERIARIDAEKRERGLLRELVKATPEE